MLRSLLCRACLILEQELEAEEKHFPPPAGSNPISIKVVESLPRSEPALRGRKIS